MRIVLWRRGCADGLAWSTGSLFAMDSRPITISVQGLTKSFYLPSQETKSRHKLQPVRRGRERELRVLDGISFEVHEGEMFGIVGANGSGKTTLMRMLASVYGPDSGSMRSSTSPACGTSPTFR